MTDRAPALELRDVAVAAGGRTLMDGVSCMVGKGGALALRGVSGCGKTTLLRAVAGLDPVRSGEILVAGRPAGTDGWPAHRRRVVFLHQTAVMLPGSIRENLARPFAYDAASGPFDEARAAGLLDVVGVPRRRLGDAARDLSVGQRQRVALVRALLLEPLVLLLDEPTSALDEDTAAAVEGTLRTARELGTALVIVTHDAAQAARLADCVLDLAPHVRAETPHAA